jgi:hypothetical protein
VLMRGLPKHYRKARPPFISATHAASTPLPGAWRGKGFLRLLLLLVAAALVAAVAANLGIARDYGYLRASILTGAAGAIIIRLRRGWPNGLSGGTARFQSYRPRARSRTSPG